MSRAPDNLTARPWTILATVSIGTFMATLDASSVNVALPTIARAWHLSIATVSWTTLIYFLVLTSAMLSVGRLSDRLHRGRSYALGMLVFGVASGLCALAPSFGWLIFLRALEATGGAVIMANSPALIATALPTHRRGAALGTVTLVATLGSSLGPTIGGLIVTHVGWHGLFLLNLPIGLVAAFLGWRVLGRLPQAKLAPGPFDLRGALLSAAGLGLSLLALREGSRWPVPVAGAIGGLGLVALIAFVHWEAGHPAPLMQPRMFARRAFASATGASLLSFAGRAGAFFLMPFFLQSVQGYTPDRVGFMMTGFPLAVAVVAPTAGAWSDRLGTRGLTVAGQLVSALALALMALLPANAPFWEPFGAQALLGVGAALFTVPNNSAMLGAVDAQDLGMASGLLAVMRNFGLALGTGGVTAILAVHGGELSEGFRQAMGASAAIAAASAAIAGLRAKSLRPVPQTAS